MKRILFFASADLEAKTGGGYANLAFYKALLHRQNIKVDLIPFSNSKPADVSSDYYAPPKSIYRKLLDFPCGIIHRYNPWIFSFLVKHGKEYDICIINDGLKGDIIAEIKKYIQVVITIHHNCEVDFQNDNNRPTALFGFFPYFVKRNEKLSYALSDLNLFLTKYDEFHFKNLYGNLHSGRCETIGIFLPSQTKLLLDKSQINPSKLAICGGLNNVQTIKGIENFKTYYHILKEEYNDNFELIISGRNPGDNIIDFAKSDDHIKLIPNPENMSDILSSSSIFICPINVGSGLKLRIMDGLKLGMPILTHEVSSRGYECFFSEPWFKVYKDEAEFRNGLKEIVDYCLNNQNVRNDIFDKFQKYFSFEAGTERLLRSIDPFIKD